MDYKITLADLQDRALNFKAAQLKKTKEQILDDFVVNGLISGWIREMMDADVSLLKGKWDSLTQIQKDQIKVIAGTEEGL